MFQGTAQSEAHNTAAPNPPASNPTAPKSAGQQSNKKREGNPFAGISSPLFSSALIPRHSRHSRLRCSLASAAFPPPRHSRFRFTPGSDACLPPRLTRLRVLPGQYASGRQSALPPLHPFPPSVGRLRPAATYRRQAPPANFTSKLRRQAPPAAAPATAGGPSRRESPLSRSGPSRPAHGAPAR